MSMTDIDEAGETSCFQSATKRVLKRKHSQMEAPENPPKLPKKSIFASISDKLGLTRNDPPKSILTTTNRGEMNQTYEHERIFATNNEEHEVPRKRVKFDEENLIVSSITYQRQQTIEDHKSLFSKIVDFTANLF